MLLSLFVLIALLYDIILIEFRDIALKPKYSIKNHCESITLRSLWSLKLHSNYLSVIHYSLLLALFVLQVLEFLFCLRSQLRANKQRVLVTLLSQELRLHFIEQTHDTLGYVVNIFSLCAYSIPLDECLVLKFNKFKFPLTKNTGVMFCWNQPSDSRENFQKLCIYFQSVASISP